MRWLVLGACLFASTAQAGSSDQLDADVDHAREVFVGLQSIRGELVKEVPPILDVRGKSALDDFKTYILPDALEAQIDALLERAKREKSGVALNDASVLIMKAGLQARALNEYWSQRPAITWRDRWRIFAQANGVSAEPPDPQLIEAERLMLKTIKAGDFYQAASLYVPQIKDLLDQAIDKQTSVLVKWKNPETLTYIPKKQPCTQTPERGSGKAAISKPASPDDYYPEAARKRNEDGAIVLSARVAPDNCATGVAIVVSSGYPDLDAAAIEVFEATTFLAPTENGVPVSGQMNFKVRFKLND